MRGKRKLYHEYERQGYIETHKKKNDEKEEYLRELSSEDEEPFSVSSRDLSFREPSRDYSDLSKYTYTSSLHRNMSKCSDSGEKKLYYDGNCYNCQDLPKETLLKIASYLGAKNVDDYSSKDTLCVLINQELINRGFASNNRYFWPLDYDTKDFQGHSLVSTLYFARNSDDRNEKDILKHLKDTELYVTAYPQHREMWENDLSQMWKYTYPNKNNNWMNAIIKFGKWRIQRELVASLLSLNQTMPGNVPKDVKRMIVFMNLLRDCDVSHEKMQMSTNNSITAEKIRNLFKDVGVYIFEEDIGDWEHPDVGKFTQKESKDDGPGFKSGFGDSNYVFQFSLPTWRTYVIGQLLNISEKIDESDKIFGKDMIWSNEYYCRMIKNNLHIKRDEIKSLFQTEMEEQLQKQKNYEDSRKKKYDPKYIGYVGGHRNVPTVKEYREKYTPDDVKEMLEERDSFSSDEKHFKRE